MAAQKSLSVTSSEKWATITPSDTALLDPKPRAIRLNAAGTITVVDEYGNSSGALNVVTGEVLHMMPHMVRSTGTTVAAANILGLY